MTNEKINKSKAPKRNLKKILKKKNQNHMLRNEKDSSGKLENRKNKNK